MADLIIGIILIAAVAAVLIKKHKDKKLGKSGCGCSCSSCAGNCGYRTDNKSAEEKTRKQSSKKKQQ